MSKATFFRQSGWMMFATVVGGAMMWLVHPLSKVIGKAEYSQYGALLSLIMMIPVGPLGVMFVQQTALALANDRRRQLTGMIRMAWLGTFVLWLVAAALALWFQKDILVALKLTQPAALWATLLVALGSLWLPIFFGLLQGEQNFLWLGWTSIINGAGRVGAAAFIVLTLGGLAAGVMTGAALGLAVTLAVSIWQTRDLWRGPAEPFDWRKLLAQVGPLMIGFGAFQILFSGDTMFAQHYFDAEETGSYVAAGTLSRALVWVVGPLTAVMFPKIIHSAAKAEKTDLLAVTLGCTAALAVGGAVALWIVAPYVVPIVYNASYSAVAIKVLPWYAGAMVVLALTNVLLSNLLGRGQFRVVPWVAVLAVAYAWALTRHHSSLVMVLQTAGLFGLLALGVCVWFTWGGRAGKPLTP